MTAQSNSQKPSLVLVTGANGFIGSSLVKALLEEGYRVRGTVRDTTDKTKTASLRAFPNADTHLDLVSLELTGPHEAFRSAMQDVEWVMHTASPVNIHMKAHENAIVGPAIRGTLALLEAALDTPTVTKFILTSSLAAIDAGHEKATLTEQDWSIIEGPGISPYVKSKTLTEQAAWHFMTDQQDNAKFTLTVINPSFVLGPISSPTVKSSTEIISHVMTDGMPAINMYIPMVDIRNVVQAHIQAAKVDEAAGKRFILNQSQDGELSLPEICAILKREFGPMGYDIKDWCMPNWLVWLVSWFNADLAALHPHLGEHPHLDNSQSRNILKIEYIPAVQTILEGTYSMIEHGIIPKKAGYKKLDFD